MASTIHPSLAHLRTLLAAVSALLLTACATAQPRVAVFADNFDAGTSASNWSVQTLAGDYQADFAFDYSTRGIPAAPNSTGGTTVGLRLAVNANDGNPAVDAVSVFTQNATFAGDYTLRGDMWLNYNGGTGGGLGSTQYAACGLNHSGDEVCYPSHSGSDGLWFAVTGEGGAGDDYCAYRGATLLSVADSGLAANSRNSSADFYMDLFPTPPFETAGAPGKQWVEFEVSRRGGVVVWRLNGRMISVRLDDAYTSGRIMLGCMDTYPSIADPPADNFVVFDNIRAEMNDCDENGVADAADIAGGTHSDCNADGIPDSCQAVSAGDYDVDGDVDADDQTALLANLGGPGQPPSSSVPACATVALAAFDANSDSALDLVDVASLQSLAIIGVFATRAAGAPTGSQFIGEVAGLGYTAREARIQQEVLGGNVPGFLREFVPITVNATIGGTPTQATYYVTPDYVSIGLDRDFMRVPMTPLIAQPIADALHCLLPTRKMVNAIWSQAPIHLSPAPISPATVDIMLATTHYRHHEMVEAQRAGNPLGPAIAGIKKDVVITPLLASNPGKVAIYGWHYTNGTPIQPLYLGHVDWYVDYSHGIRLVRDRMLVNGVEMAVADVLADPDLCVLLSDEGVITNPRY